MGSSTIVKTGERIPLDGVVTEGESELDTSALTGEFLPVEVKAGDNVLSGSTNLRGLLKVKEMSANNGSRNKKAESGEINVSRK